MSDLKSCPFCGGKVDIAYDSSAKAFSVFHTDSDSDCIFIEPLWIDGEYAKSLKDAYNLWNMRVDIK